MNTLEKAKILQDICAIEIETFIQKNTDYGDSFSETRREIPEAILIRLHDKYARLKRLLKGNPALVKDESIDDTLMDLANYANMELLERRIDKLDEQKRSTQTVFVDNEPYMTLTNLAE